MSTGLRAVVATLSCALSLHAFGASASAKPQMFSFALNVVGKYQSSDILIEPSAYSDPLETGCTSMRQEQNDFNFTLAATVAIDPSPRPTVDGIHGVVRRVVPVQYAAGSASSEAFHSSVAPTDQDGLGCPAGEQRCQGNIEPVGSGSMFFVWFNSLGLDFTFTGPTMFRFSSPFTGTSTGSTTDYAPPSCAEATRNVPPPEVADNLFQPADGLLSLHHDTLANVMWGELPMNGAWLPPSVGDESTFGDHLFTTFSNHGEVPIHQMFPGDGMQRFTAYFDECEGKPPGYTCSQSLTYKVRLRVRRVR